MLTGLWPSPSGAREYALSFDRGRAHRVLVIPALFEEGNKLRRFTVDVMRHLDAAGIDCLLPDLPGTNESMAALSDQTLEGWRNAARAAAQHFRAGHLLCVRGGALLDWGELRSFHYASTSGASLLRMLARAQAMAEKEAGSGTNSEQLLEAGKQDGVTLAGFALGPQMVRELLVAKPGALRAVSTSQDELGGPGLWLRAEPAHDAGQAGKLANLVAKALA